MASASGIDEEALFALAERSNAIGDGVWEQEGEDSADEEDDETQHGTMLMKLEDGGWHVCRGMNCPHLVQSSEVDRSYSCQLSGRFIASCCEAAHDASWTGRSCTSADPDMQSGAAGGPAWRGKRNAFSASAAAYKAAAQMTIADVSFEFDDGSQRYDGSRTPFDTSVYTHKCNTTACGAGASSSSAPTSADEPAKDVKRGAPCVVDVDDVAVQAQKRTKAIRRIASLNEKTTQLRLLNDASTVVVKLFSVLPTAGSSASASAPSKKDHATAGGAATLADPRLENYDFVLNMALKRYVARCKDRGERASMSGIHDVCIAANQFVKQRRKEARERSTAAALGGDRRVAVDGKSIELCSQLIFAMWVAMCCSPYFTEYQTGDSFRPFAAGVMYALKRGLRLPNNMVLVPAIEKLANRLPTLRSATATPAAKQLQQASHRGLCAIARGISSIDSMSDDDQQVALKQLRTVSAIATRLSKYVRENS
jgi:hypothetical protein